MPRSATAAVALLAAGTVQIALAHHHAVPLDYIGLVLASGASWFGVPGPGEPVLLAAGVLAAKHQLDLATVLIVAWLAASAGGIAGWLVGLKAGRAVVTAPGPLRALRQRTVEHGEEIFERHPITAILVTPAFVAGIHGVRSRVFLAINISSAAVWASGIGVAGYLVGPSVLDIFSDVGPALSVVIIIVVIGLVGLQVIRHRARVREAELQHEAESQLEAELRHEKDDSGDDGAEG
ncbi:MAG: DedA family protein [Solirubrobacteraceae bacterium]